MLSKCHGHYVNGTVARQIHCIQRAIFCWKLEVNAGNQEKNIENNGNIYHRTLQAALKMNRLLSDHVTVEVGDVVIVISKLSHK